MSRVHWRPTADAATLDRRADLLADLRAFLRDRNCREIDTPALANGVIAERNLRPMATDTGHYLTTSPEAALKRLVAAGHGDVFQLGHVYRADETGRWHRPVFCLLEWYRVGADMRAVIDETDVLLQTVAAAPAATRQSFTAVFECYVGVDPITADVNELAAAARDLNVAPSHGMFYNDRRAWIDLLTSLVVQPHLGFERPTCLTHFPAGDGALVAPADDGLAQRFEFYWHGVELANGAFELCDAKVAEQRMADNRGDAPTDQAVIEAMRSGLPRCAGVALGVDRLLALMLGRNAVESVMPFADL